MDYPRHRTLEAIANLKFHSTCRPIAPATPVTDEDIRAFHAFCQIWSWIWGYAHLNVNATDQTIYQEDTHVR